jgi:aryl-alcohol dehydrogenase-like predicted oxidoreductase
VQKRQLGRSDIRLPPVMFGGNVFGWTTDEATSFKLLDACVAAGINAIDTADVYSVWVKGHQGGESEIVIGNWLKKRGKRDDVIIATKVGAPMGSGDKGLSRSWIMKECDASLKRLQTDVIDLYQAHRDDPETPQEETAQAFADLVKQGKVRALGASQRSMSAISTAGRAMSRFSRCTIWSSVRRSRMSWKGCARPRILASSTTMHWRQGSLPANTGQRWTWERARVAVARRSI